MRERRAARGFRRGRHAKHVSDTLHGPRNPGVPGGSPAPALRVELRLKELSKSCAINEGGLKAPAPISSRLSSLLGAKTTGRTVWNNFPSQTEPPRRGVPDRARCLISGACAVQGTLSVGARGLRIFRQFRYQAPPWRCGAGLNSEFLLPARCSLFSLAPEASWGAPPWRCGAGLNSKNAQGRAARGTYFIFRGPFGLSQL